jgi:hypothetical protein
MRVIGCDCGFEAADDGEGGLVERGQDHARRVHGMELPAELILALARGAPKDGAPSRPDDTSHR